MQKVAGGMNPVGVWASNFGVVVVVVHGGGGDGGGTQLLMEAERVASCIIHLQVVLILLLTWNREMVIWSRVEDHHSFS